MSKRLSDSLRCAMLLAACSGCVWLGTSPDNPNREPSIQAYGTATTWSVTDEAGTVLASGCSAGEPSPLVHVPTGTRLMYETREFSAKLLADGSDDDACAEQSAGTRFPMSHVANLACFTMPETGPLVVVSWEAVPAPRDAGTINPDRMKGQGVHMVIDVVEHGSLVLDPNGSCRVDPTGVLTAVE